MVYLLDTNVLVDYLSGRFPRVTRRVQENNPEDLCTSSVVVAELRYGADKSARRAENHARLALLLEEILCLDFDTRAALAYGSLRADLERRGQIIGPYDMMIAAQALALDLTLVSDNIEEFRRVPGLKLENWRTQ